MTSTLTVSKTLSRLAGIITPKLVEVAIQNWTEIAPDARVQLTLAASVLIHHCGRYPEGVCERSRNVWSKSVMHSAVRTRGSCKSL